MCELRLEIVRQADPEDIRWQVSPFLTAERTLGSEPHIRYGQDWCRDVLMTALASNDRRVDAGFGGVEHGTV